MAPTVDDLRNDIRLAADRFEREVSTDFTKEDLAAICAAVGDDVDQNNFPSKPRMRAGILSAVGERPEDEQREASFRKAELEAIADALDAP